MTAVGFEPTPFRTSALSWRLRPLGHAVNADDLGSTDVRIEEQQINLKAGEPGHRSQCLSHAKRALYHLS